MKKIFTLIIALMLVLGLTQCKKNEVATIATDENVYITLNANYGGEKSDFTPGTDNGTFVWSDGATEYIYVGGKKSGHLGELTGTGNGTNSITFSGNISAPAAGETTLNFFYLGNGSHDGTTLDFSAQDGTLANITDYHIAVGMVEYNSGNSFSTNLTMKSAFARINMSGFSGETVYVQGDGIYTTANIDYNNGTITGAAKGSINVGTASADKFIAFIPSTTSETTVNFYSDTKFGSMTFNTGIQAGKFYAKTDASALDLSTSLKAFSVSATKQVFFSPGNLQYKPSTSTWRFAEHQYDICVDVNQLHYWFQQLNGGSWIEVTENFYHEKLYDPNIDLSDYYDNWCSKYDVSSQYVAGGSSWIDLFGWGTWGPGKTPYSVSTNDNDYTWSGDFSGTISNDDATGWRTLTNAEWTYLLEGRSNASSLYGYGTVAGIHGLILLPDIFTDPNTNGGSGAFMPQSSAEGWDANVYTSGNWALMESAGAVFLPAAGRRAIEPNYQPFTSLSDVKDVGDWGAYWSSTPINSTYSYGMFIVEGSGLWFEDWGETKRSEGSSVRLVREVPSSK